VLINELSETDLRTLNRLLNIVPNDEEMMINVRKLNVIPIYQVGDRKVTHNASINIEKYEETEEFALTWKRDN
jgi:hypothetical protein